MTAESDPAARLLRGTAARRGAKPQDRRRPAAPPAPKKRPAGKVWLVGAGPGDPELLTLKARRVLAAAGAVFYDELVSPAILDYAPAGCERVYAGKRHRHHALPQAELVALMIARARGGASVVRLKGGDPFLFGRGGEEADQLAAAGIPWEIVPGISAGLAVPALAAIPLTHRAHASAVVFRTGHRCAESSAPGPSPRPTQVVFMGLERLPEIARQLQAEGYPPQTPAAVISQGTLPGQRVVTGTLAAIAARVRRAGLRSPALIVVGDVVACRERWRAAPAAPPTAAGSAPGGIILLAHGSPVPAGHASVERLCAELAAGGRFVRAAYLPPARPSLLEAVAAAAAAGQPRAAVVPYFLAAGLHVARDIPALVAEAQARFPGVALALAPSLDGHPALRTAVLSRAERALDTSDGN